MKSRGERGGKDKGYCWQEDGTNNLTNRSKRKKRKRRKNEEKREKVRKRKWTIGESAMKERKSEDEEKGPKID